MAYRVGKTVLALTGLGHGPLTACAGAGHERLRECFYVACPGPRACRVQYEVVGDIPEYGLIGVPGDGREVQDRGAVVDEGEGGGLHVQRQWQRGLLRVPESSGCARAPPPPLATRTVYSTAYS